MPTASADRHQCSAPGPAGPAGSLLVVGVVHLDPNGYGKALQFFQRHRPDLILVELSPFGRRFRRKHGKALRKRLRKNLKKAAKSSAMSCSRARRHPAVRNIFRQFALPFEYRAAVRYAGTSGARVVLVDSSRFSRYWIGFWPELTAVDNLQKLLASAAAHPSAPSIYRAAQNSLRSQPNGAHPQVRFEVGCQDEMWGEREHHLADRILDTLTRRRPHRPIYIGGWQHLTVNAVSPTLRQILRLEPSQCCLLADEKQSPQGQFTHCPRSGSSLAADNRC